MTDIDFSFAALDLASRGWPVFPCELKIGDDPISLSDVEPGMRVKKVPIGALVENGYKEATTRPKKISLWWRVRPDALVGVALPKNTMVVDVDVPDAFDKAGLEFPENTPMQRTLSGGYHAFFKTDGRPVRQTVKEIPGADTRVGGRGYVVAWDPEAFPSPDDMPDAPEWVYGSSDAIQDGAEPRRAMSVRRVRRTGVEVATIKVGSRDNELARTAGSLRKAGLGPDAIYAAFLAMLDNGQIESPREDPITDKDLRRIAGSIGVRQSDAVDRQSRPAPERHYAADLIYKPLRPLEYLVDEIFPEGLGIVAGAPKVGKSWLTFQSAVEIATQGEVLGRDVPEARPVLYYGLEDGERRFQARLRMIVGARRLDLSLLELRYEAPRIGDGLEDDVGRWLDDNPGGAVFVDVLAKVRPESKGRGSAYDEDYSVIGPLQTVSKERPGSAIVIVTHDRKMGSDDPLTTVTGTRGIVGAADWIWVIKRERLKVEGTLFVTGRDIEKEPSIDCVFAGIWSLAPTAMGGGTKGRDEILEALMTEGDMTAQEIFDFLNPDDAGSDTGRRATETKLHALENKGRAGRSGFKRGEGRGRPPVLWHRISDEERAERVAEERTKAAIAIDKRGSMPITRVRGGARARARLAASADAREEVGAVNTETP